MDKKLTLTVSLAAALTGLSGCSSRAQEVTAANNTRICVDEWGSRIDDDYCGRRSGYVGGSRFFYLRSGSPIPYYYDNVRDARYARYGSYDPPSGFTTRAPATTNMARSAAISRGGLGSSGRSFGGRGG